MNIEALLKQMKKYGGQGKLVVVCHPSNNLRALSGDPVLEVQTDPDCPMDRVYVFPKVTTN